MSELEQLSLLTAESAVPDRWPCPTCRGNRQMIRILYPDEVVAGGPLTEVCRCRTCEGQGTVTFDPDDKAEFGY